MTLSFDDALAIIADRTAALRAAVDGNEDAVVPSCPGWTGRDLASHLAEVHRFWALAVEIGPERPSEDAAPAVAAQAHGADLRADSEDAAAALLGALRDAGPDRPVWSWWGPATSGDIARHQVQEASVHAWDADQLAGPDLAGATLPPAAALDGIDEFLTVELTDVTATEWSPPPATVALVATGAPQAWVVRLDDRHPVVQRVAAGDVEEAKADATLHGSAAELVLALYGRLGFHTLAIDGDPDVAARFVSSFDTE